MHNRHGEDLNIWWSMCSIPKLINFMCSNMEVRDETIGVKVGRRIAITIFSRA